MNTEQLNRTLGLLRRTGDKAVVLDPASDHVFVMMDLDDYEGLLDEADFPDPKNGPLGKNSQSKDEEDPLQDYVLDDILPAEVPNSTAPEVFLTPEELVETARPITVNQDKSSEVSQKKPELDWVESEPVVTPLKSEAILSEESLSDLPNEEEEEKFYLEPIEES